MTPPDPRKLPAPGPARPGAPQPSRPARGRRRDEPTYQITGARRALSEEIDARTRRYLLSMGIRTACLVLAFFTVGWPRWGFIAGAVVLPYFAVVFANAGREPNRDLPSTMLSDTRPALEAGPSRETGDAA